MVDMVHSGLTASIPGGDEAGGAHTPVTPFTPGHLYFDDPTWDQKIALRGRKTVYGQPYVVAHVNRPGSARSDDDKRYARLFCAAPDLLTAGQELQSARKAQKLAPSAENLSRVRIASDAFDAAIAKATQPAKSQQEGEGA